MPDNDASFHPPKFTYDFWCGTCQSRHEPFSAPFPTRALAESSRSDYAKLVYVNTISDVRECLPW